MRNTNKKGFTIVELVVVVAVIAILAAVLIPTFSGIIKKANIASDTAVAKNLNTAAIAAEAKDFDEAITAIKDAGYLLANLNAKTNDYYFVWDEVNDQFLLVDEQFNVVYSNKEASPKGSDWCIAVIPSEAGDIDSALTVKLIGVTVSDFNTVVTEGGKQTIYLDENIVMDDKNTIEVDNPNAEITIVLTGSNVASVGDMVDKFPFNVKQGKLSLVGGNVSATAQFLNPDNKEVKAPVIAYDGSTLDIKDTNFVIDAGNVKGYLRYQGGDGLLDNVTVDSNDMGILANGGSKVTLKDCNFTAGSRAVWSCSHDVNAPTIVTIQSGNYVVDEAIDWEGKVYGTLTTCGGEIVVEGGKFFSETGYLFYNHGIVNGNPTDKITITGGEFVVGNQVMTFAELAATVDSGENGADGNIWSTIAKNFTSITKDANGAIVLTSLGN